VSDPALARLKRIDGAIYFVRGQRVMIDSDLAALYGVPTKALNQAVRRNIERFPDDFLFVVTAEELANLRSQIVTSRHGHGGRRVAAYAFTEQGIAMLSSVLRGPRAVQVNIEIDQLIAPPATKQRRIGFKVRSKR
jgi:hypothetical protein